MAHSPSGLSKVYGQQMRPLEAVALYDFSRFC
jgi:hypothetical protein